MTRFVTRLVLLAAACSTCWAQTKVTETMGVIPPNAGTRSQPLAIQGDDPAKLKITQFDVPGAGTNGATGQGTLPGNINPAGTVSGFIRDMNDVRHGFLRSSAGEFTIFDATGAGTAPFQGTRTYGLTPTGVTAGYYDDSSGLYHGYVRAKDGTITAFDAPDAGTGTGQGTFPETENSSGAITGASFDSGGVNHGFLRAKDGTITTFEALGAGIGSGQGIIPFSINSSNVMTGSYSDGSGVNHGFLATFCGNGDEKCEGKTGEDVVLPTSPAPQAAAHETSPRSLMQPD